MQITARTSLRARSAALAAAAAAAVAGSFAFAGASDARPIKDTAGSKGCPVEHEDGSVTYVPVGTQVGLFKCGSDGEWHFGWLVDHMVAGDGGTTTGPVVSGTLAPASRY
jgi:hypothetical protein